MNDNEEKIRIKLPLDNLSPKTENKPDTSDIPPQREGQNIPPAPKPAPAPSSTGNQEGLKLKLKIPGAKLPETEEKGIPIQDVKLNPIKSASDITAKREGSPQPPPKSNEYSSSNFSAAGPGEDTLSNIVNTQEEKNNKMYDSINNISESISKSGEKNIKYLYIAGALVVIIILLYLMISTIKTLMTI